MKIMIFGGSGVGKTTLGASVAKQIDFIHLDSDNYYWKITRPTFQMKRTLALRNEKIKAEFNKHHNVIVSGSMMTWGNEWNTAFDLAVFIRLDNEMRLARLRKRDIERYGDNLLNNEKIKENSSLFLEWANQYENPYYPGNNLYFHKKWLKSCTCSVLRLDGKYPLKTNINKVLEKIEEH